MVQSGNRRNEIKGAAGKRVGHHITFHKRDSRFRTVGSLGLRQTAGIDIDGDYLFATSGQLLREQPLTASHLERAPAVRWNRVHHDAVIVNIVVPRAGHRSLNEKPTRLKRHPRLPKRSTRPTSPIHSRRAFCECVRPRPSESPPNPDRIAPRTSRTTNPQSSTLPNLTEIP